MKFKLLVSFFIISCSVYAQKARKYSNEFLSIGVDASAMAMSNSVVASTNNVNAVYWNPSGLMHLTEQEVSLMHASYFANIAQYDYIGYAMPVDEKSAIGFSLIRFGVDDIMNTTELIDQNGNINYDKISMFSTADYAFSLSYARATPVTGLHWGVNAKVIRRVIGKFANSWGFGFDLGMQYSLNSGWKVGLMARDITTTYNMWTINKKEFEKISNAIPGQNTELPQTTEITLPKVQLGIARRFDLNTKIAVLAELGAQMEFAQSQAILSTKGLSVYPSLGTEVSYANMVFVRAGLGNFQHIKQIDGSDKVGFQPNLGVGFNYKGIQVDYALTDIGDQSVALYSNVFSLRVDLGIFNN